METVDSTLEQTEQRWQLLNLLLSDTKHKVVLSHRTKRFYDQLAALHDVLAVYEKWAKTEERAADEALDISRQLEQCRVCINNLNLILKCLNLLNPLDASKHPWRMT